MQFFGPIYQINNCVKMLFGNTLILLWMYLPHKYWRHKHIFYLTVIFLKSAEIVCFGRQRVPWEESLLNKRGGWEWRISHGEILRADSSPGARGLQVGSNITNSYVDALLVPTDWIIQKGNSSHPPGSVGGVHFLVPCWIGKELRCMGVWALAETVASRIKC